MATARHKQNEVLKLQDKSRVWHEWPDDLGLHIVEYFGILFTGQSSNVEAVTECISPWVTNAHASLLNSPFDATEVKDDLSSMHPDKSLSPNGLIPGFFSNFGTRWALILKQLV